MLKERAAAENICFAEKTSHQRWMSFAVVEGTAAAERQGAAGAGRRRQAAGGGTGGAPTQLVQRARRLPAEAAQPALPARLPPLPPLQLPHEQPLRRYF